MTSQNPPARHRTSTSPHTYPCDLCKREFLDYNQMRRHRLECKREGYSRGMARETDDPDKYIKGKYGHMVCRTLPDLERIVAEGKLRETLAKRPPTVWECIGCGKLTYDVGVTADSPGLEIRKTTYCLACLRGW